MSQAELEARWAADPDPVFRRAREIAEEALKIGWYNTESAARRVAEVAAEQLIKAEAGQVAGFYEEEHPFFEQGPCRHELQELVTAEQCKEWCALIAQHIKLCEWLKANLERTDLLSFLIDLRAFLQTLDKGKG